MTCINSHHARIFTSAGWGLLFARRIAVFGVVSTNFFTRENAFRIGGLSVEIGLLALACAGHHLPGEIDLSAGSLLGLAAVVLGMLWRDAGWPVATAALLAVITGGLGRMAQRGFHNLRPGILR